MIQLTQKGIPLARAKTARNEGVYERRIITVILRSTMTTTAHEHHFLHLLHHGSIATGVDVFYCARCLEYRSVNRDEQPAMQHLSGDDRPLSDNDRVAANAMAEVIREEQQRP